MGRENPFTMTKLKAAEPDPAKRYDIADPHTPGLVLTVTPNGTKTYYWRRKLMGKVVRERIGAFDEVLIGDAQRRAAEFNAGKVKGIDPGEVRRAARRAMTVGQLWTMYREKHRTKRGTRKRDERGDLNRWTRHVAPAWGSRRIGSIEREDVVKLVEHIRENAGPVQANRVRSLLHGVFADAVKWRLVTVNPLAGTAKDLATKETPKKRFLSVSEMKRFLGALDDEPDRDLRDWCRLMLFTGQRGHTVFSMRWVDIDLREAVWTVPGEYMKAGRELAVPLAPAVVALLHERRPFVRASSPWVFPSRRAESGHMVKLRGAFSDLLDRAGIENLTPHDLRRTHASWALSVGVPLEIIGKALGHTEVGGVTSIYAQADIELVRVAVEKTVKAMLAAAAAPDGADGKLLAVVVPAWAREEAS